MPTPPPGLPLESLTNLAHNASTGSLRCRAALPHLESYLLCTQGIPVPSNSSLDLVIVSPDLPLATMVGSLTHSYSHRLSSSAGPASSAGSSNRRVWLSLFGSSAASSTPDTTGGTSYGR